MIHTDEDDEFERIEREQKIKGQPYHWEADVIKAAIKIEREECARLCEEMRTYVGRNNAVTQSSAQDCATAIRARGQA